MKGFRFGSTEGSFYIMPGKDGWEASFGNETLGAFASPQQAADDLANGVICPRLILRCSRYRRRSATGKSFTFDGAA